MLIPPPYHIGPEMLSIIAKIDAHKEFIASIEPPTLVIEKIQRASLLKSSLYSARIEGSLVSFAELDEKQQEQKEIFNILKAIRHIKSHMAKGTKITKKTLLTLHDITMTGINSSAGKLRNEPTAIFNQAGVAIYMPPPPVKINEYLNNLLLYINGKQEQFPLVNAFISHLVFEKIHPFLDGNGRVGRLLIYAIFQTKGYDFGIHIPFEEYIDTHKEDYYYFLDFGIQQPNEYLLFMLKSYLVETENIKKQLLAEQSKKITVALPPRQEELYNIVKDHVTVSFDFIRRRFVKIPDRTLRYDLKKLTDAHLVIKIGKTRGVFYTIKGI